MFLCISNPIPIAEPYQVVEYMNNGNIEPVAKCAYQNKGPVNEELINKDVVNTGAFG
jgi:hypothetical protein